MKTLVEQSMQRESFQYYLLKASNKVAEEKGHCENFGRTKYADGILPIDTYKKDVDEICTLPLQHDWESLRASILEHGLRHSTSANLTELSSFMPLSPSEIRITITKNKKVVITTERPIPAAYLFALKAL